MLILSGCSIEAIKLQTTAATTTAVDPFGQAVANQKADVTAIASAERSPVRAAETGSDHSRQAMSGSGNCSPRSKAPMRSRSRARARARSRSSAARTSADTIGPSPARDSCAWEIPLLGVVFFSARGGESTRWLAAASAMAQSSTAAWVNLRSGWSRTRSSPLSKYGERCPAWTSR